MDKSNAAVSGEVALADGPSAEQVRDWLLAALGARTSGARINPAVPISRYGIDSVELVEMAAELEGFLGRRVPVEALRDFPSVDVLAHRLAGDGSPPQAAARPPVHPLRPVGRVEMPTETELASALSVRLSELSALHLELQSRGEYHFRETVEPADGVYTQVRGERMLMAASYSYLGLLGHPAIREAASDAAARYGTGSHGSPLLSGTTPLHNALESELAAFLGGESAILYSSGFVANLSTLAALMGPDDVIIGDRTNHASLHAGCRHSGAQFLQYLPEDMADLEACLQMAEGMLKLVVVDAVFSMSGRVLDLPRVVELCRRYGAALMVDEAHSFGVIGRTGRGIEEHFGMHGVVDIKMATLSKALPSSGGFVTGKRSLIDALRHGAHGHIFSGALAPPQVAAARAALGLLRDEPSRVERLAESGRYYREALRANGFDVTLDPTPIVPIVCRDNAGCYRMTRACQAAGVFVLPVVYPAVPLDAPRLRTTVTAEHTRADIDRLVDVLTRAARECGLVEA